CLCSSCHLKIAFNKPLQQLPTYSNSIVPSNNSLLASEPSTSSNVFQFCSASVASFNAEATRCTTLPGIMPQPGQTIMLQHAALTKTVKQAAVTCLVNTSQANYCE